MRGATDLVALIGEQTALKRVGRRFVGLCPFHAEKTPSFSVNAEEGLYYCFGCQASGDAISYVRQTEGLDFVEAVERLAARAGVTIRVEGDRAGDKERGRRRELLDALGKATAFYHERLLETKDAGRARNYLRSRGYDGDVVRRFQLGYAPAGFDELVRALKLPGPVLRAAGLAFENQRGRLQDAFRDRVMFPIFDAGGQAIAFGGRVLPEGLRTGDYEAGPKYRNSPESAVYSKRRTLYGLNWAKAEIARTNEVVVCEGYTDVIGFHAAGLARAVATCGTALTEDHFRTLAHFAKRVVLAFDADAAGQAAAARLYEWERRHEIELAVAGFPPGADPGELARSDPEALVQAVDAARPFLGFRVDQALSAEDLRSPEGRSRAAEAALAAIVEHPNEIVRDQYLVEVADRTQISPDRLRELLRATRRAPSRAEGAIGEGAPKRGAIEARRDGDASKRPSDRVVVPRRRDDERAGLDAIVLVIERPQETTELFDELLFSDPVQQSAFRTLRAAPSLSAAIENADPDAGDLLRRLAVSQVPEDLDPEGTYLALVRATAGRALRELDAEGRVAERDGKDDSVVAYLDASTWLRTELEALHDPLVRVGATPEEMDTARRLVAWLVERQREAG